jgi:hypothetical protein
MIGLYSGGDPMHMHGTASNPFFFSKKIFYIHLSSAIILTIIGPIFFILLPVMWGYSLERLFMSSFQNYTMISLWIIYLIVICTLPLVYILTKNTSKNDLL